MNNHRSRLSAAAFFVLLGTFCVPPSTFDVSARVHAQAPAVQAAAPATAGSARLWDGRNEAYETFIRAADIDRFEDVPIGVTHPRRAYFKPDGLVASVAWKNIPPGRPNGFWESYKSEIAAYELDKLLDLRMVPVAVEKKWKGETAAAILWLKPIHPWKEMEPKPKPETWARQVVRMKMFDNLIGNPDRNAGNLMVDDAWNLFLIDHSRAFVGTNALPFKMEHVDRPFWDRMLALDEPALAGALGKWLDKSTIRAILSRRDKMKSTIDALVKKNREAAVFIQ